MLRAILALLFAILYLIIGIPVLFVEWIIGKFNRQAADISQLRMVQWAFRVILFICGTKLTIIGEENVPKDQPVLYIGNHRSYFDIIITYSRCPRLTGYVAKDSMKKVPLLSTWMTRLHCLFINRSDVKEALKTILAGIDNIKNGISMCIFPEGTRNKTDDLMLPFKEGSFKIAEKSGCPIIPMAITNSADVLEAHMPRVKKAHVIEYLLPNLIITLAVKSNPEVEQAIPYMNSDYSEYLVKALADDYSEEKWNWIKKLTGIHKLTYKLDADIKHGHNFYDYLITSSDEKNTK